ncbi:hypothetical protein PHLCEN_2v1436 [Hermanssonia centrifuga]|uniref:Uncharacterized protein n=1 Tax=Hermanssonia centrifuga TaxID=98765 RepID=A0A2R6S005_9APHY|nr:hypothetical protein PHLCEN_2v1436 [Hermanssonia centrifuga]
MTARSRVCDVSIGLAPGLPVEHLRVKRESDSPITLGHSEFIRVGMTIQFPKTFGGTRYT